MSIATLKRKTQTQYHNMSVGSKNGGFSLNGTHRSQGYVGQTSLSRSLPQTSMKGNAIKGHGGCCGKYPIQPIVQSGVVSENDPNVVKPSVIDTAGMLRTHYKWIWRPQPFSVVKPDSTNNLNTQESHIRYVSRNNVSKIDSCNIIGADKPCQTQNVCGNLSSLQRPRSSIIPTTRFAMHIVKPESSIVATSQGKYIEKISGGCSTITNDKFAFSTNANRTPFAC